jgi:hypothetical protein
MDKAHGLILLCSKRSATFWDTGKGSRHAASE